jgi:tetratricopeptide (TPR) repeat protein
VVVSALPDTQWRQERELDLQIALGQALTANRSWSAPELAEVHSRARGLAMKLHRPRALLFALWGQYRDHWARADLKRARRLAAELRELGDAAGDVLAQVMGCQTGGSTCFHLGEFAAGQAQLEKGLALYDPAYRSSYSELVPFDVRGHFRTVLSWLLACLGHFDQALRQRDAGLEEARRLSHPPTLVYALGGAWTTGSFLRSQAQGLLQQADELLRLATEHGLGFFQALALIQRGWSLTALERTDEGVPLITGGLAGWDELGFLLFSPWRLTLLADACRMAGQWQAAVEHLAEARRRA